MSFQSFGNLARMGLQKRMPCPRNLDMLGIDVEAGEFAHRGKRNVGIVGGPECDYRNFRAGDANVIGGGRFAQQMAPRGQECRQIATLSCLCGLQVFEIRDDGGEAEMLDQFTTERSATERDGQPIAYDRRSP